MGTLLDGASIFVNNAAGSMQLEDNGGNIVVRKSPIVVANNEGVVLAKNVNNQNTIAEIRVVTDVKSSNVNIIVDENKNNVTSVANAVALAVNTSDDSDIVVLNNSVKDSVVVDAGADIIRVNGGTSVNVDAGDDTDIVVASGEDHNINGGDGSDILCISKDAGNNMTVNGGAGNDIITVSAGSGHTLIGGAGNDKYVISNLEAEGNYIIDQTNALNTDRDTISLSKYNQNEFEFMLSNNNDLVMTYSNGGVVIVKGWDQHKLANIVFKDNTLSGNKLNEIADLKNNNYILMNQSLSYYGTEARDIFVLSGDSLNCNINNYSSIDVLDFHDCYDNDADIAIKMLKNGNDLELLIPSLEDNEDEDLVSSVTLKDYYLKNMYPHIIFEDGLDTILASGTDNDDTVYLYTKYYNKINYSDAVGVTYFAGAGNDKIYAGGNQDGNGTGQWNIYGGSGTNDINIKSNNGNVYISGQKAKNNINIAEADCVTVVGGCTADSFYDPEYIAGTLEGDTINITASRDVLVYGNGGKDVISVNGDGSQDSCVFVEGSDGDDIIDVSNFNDVEIAGDLGNDEYIVDWASCRKVLVRNDNEGINWDDIVCQEKDVLKLTGVSLNDVECYTNGTELLIIPAGAVLTNPSSWKKCITITNWNNNALSKIVVGEQVLSTSDINDIAKPYNNVINGKLYITYSGEYDVSRGVSSIVFTDSNFNVVLKNMPNGSSYYNCCFFDIGNFTCDGIRYYKTGKDGIIEFILTTAEEKTIIGTVLLENCLDKVDNNGHFNLFFTRNGWEYMGPYFNNYPYNTDTSYYMFNARNGISFNEDAVSATIMGENQDINILGGNDISIISWGEANTYNIYDGSDIYVLGGTGKDTINVFGGDTININSSEGSDSIYIDWNNTSNITIVGYSGLDDLLIKGLNYSDMKFIQKGSELYVYDKTGKQLVIKNWRSEVNTINFNDDIVLSNKDISEIINNGFDNEGTVLNISNPGLYVVDNKCKKVNYNTFEGTATIYNFTNSISFNFDSVNNGNYYLKTVKDSNNTCFDIVNATNNDFNSRIVFINYYCGNFTIEGMGECDAFSDTNILMLNSGEILINDSQAKIIGTSGNDSIVINGEENVIESGTGEDTIIVNGNSNKVNTSTDTILYINGYNTKITQHTGSNKVFVNGKNTLFENNINYNTDYFYIDFNKADGSRIYIDSKDIVEINGVDVDTVKFKYNSYDKELLIMDDCDNKVVISKWYDYDNFSIKFGENLKLTYDDIMQDIEEYSSNFYISSTKEFCYSNINRYAYLEEYGWNAVLYDYERNYDIYGSLNIDYYNKDNIKISSKIDGNDTLLKIVNTSTNETSTLVLKDFQETVWIRRNNQVKLLHDNDVEYFSACELCFDAYSEGYYDINQLAHNLNFVGEGWNVTLDNYNYKDGTTRRDLYFSSLPKNYGFKFKANGDDVIVSIIDMSDRNQTEKGRIVLKNYNLYNYDELEICCKVPAGHDYRKFYYDHSYAETTVIYGTYSDDYIVVDEDNSKVYFEGGKDTCEILSDNNEISGYGRDFYVHGNSNTIYYAKNVIVGENANQNNFYYCDNITINGGENNILENIGYYASGNVIVNNGIIDKIKFYNYGYDDEITVFGGEVGTIETGYRNDVINVSGGNVETVKSGNGDDEITVSGGEVGSIETYWGNDVIVVENGQIGSIDTYFGDNTIIVNGGKIDELILGSGSDDVRINGGEIGNIKNVNHSILNITGGIIDYIKISSDKLSVSGGSFKNLVATYEGDFDVDVNMENNGYIKGNYEDNKISIRSGINETIETGYGNDDVYIYWNKAKNITVITAGYSFQYNNVTLYDANVANFTFSMIEKSNGWDLLMTDVNDNYVKVVSMDSNDTITFENGGVLSYNDIYNRAKDNKIEEVNVLNIAMLSFEDTGITTSSLDSRGLEDENLIKVTSNI